MMTTMMTIDDDDNDNDDDDDNNDDDTSLPIIVTWSASNIPATSIHNSNTLDIFQCLLINT